MREQDQRLDTLSDTVKTLHVMGNQIDTAIKEHEGLLLTMQLLLTIK